MNKVFKKILIGTGITAIGTGAAVGMSYYVTKNLVGVAMDRKTPKIMKKNIHKITGGEQITENIDRMEAAEEKLMNCGCETVEIESHDGLRLVGHLHTCEKPKRIIIAMHGWRSAWSKDFSIISDLWHDNNCIVLYAEQRAHGNSEGAYMSFGLNERYDCFAWVNWINGRTGGNLPIYLAGISMGATTVLMSAGLELPENVKGIIADCGFTSSNEIWKHVVKNNLHLSYGSFESLIAEKVSRKKSGLGTKDYSTEDAMRVCKIPVLFIHGSDDKFVPIEMTYRNYKACAAPKKLLVVPGAGHGMSYLVEQRLYEDTVKEFWNKYDN